jgi:membrane protein YqaA with SNARE-associated domain
MSWLPVIGDVLCLAAGWIKLNLLKSICFILLGKLARYSLIAILLS